MNSEKSQKDNLIQRRNNFDLKSASDNLEYGRLANQMQQVNQGYGNSVIQSMSYNAGNKVSSDDHIKQLKEENEEDKLLQKKEGADKENKDLKSGPGGLPEGLKNGVENLSGLSMDDVQVHYNSPKPASVNALAYAQGKDIHLGAGQEKHLPHEAWHVVQQMQGRVQQTTQLKGVSINDDDNLEKEADVMGEKALEEKINSENVNKQNSSGETGAVVQKKIAFQKELEEGDIASLDGILNIGVDKIKEALESLKGSPIDYGFIDLEKSQHKEMLLYNIQNIIGNDNVKDQEGEIEKQQKEWVKQKEGRANVFKLAFLGAGSSVAYYINSLGRTYDHSETIVIGDIDPWKDKDSEKSRGQGYIGHTQQEIAPQGESVPKYDETLVDRKDFAVQNENQIERIPNQNLFKYNIREVKKSRDSDLYTIRTDKRIFYARKVVVGVGAGPHTIAPEAEKLYSEHEDNKAAVKERVMDMDAFMRCLKMDEKEPDFGNGQRVIVVGPNAGIDVIEAAGRTGFETKWFISGGGSPALLPGASLQQHHAQRAVKEDTIVARRNSTKLKYSDSRPYITVDYFDEGTKKEETLTGDFYVYAIGQDSNAPGAPGDILSGIKGELEPVYDKNMAMGDAPYKTVLGLQMPGTDRESGLEVIGASAYSLGTGVNHNYLQNAYSELLGLCLELNQKQNGVFAATSPWSKFSSSNLRTSLEAGLEFFHKSDGGAAEDLSAEGNLLVKRIETDVASLDELTLTMEDFNDGVSVGNEHPDSLNNIRSFFRNSFRSVLLKIKDLTEASVYFSKTNQKLVAKDINDHIVPNKQAGTGVISELMNQVRSQPTDILLPPQLGPVRSSVAAMNSFMPDYITGESNYSSDDRNMLRTFIAVNYPSLNEEDAQHVMSMILGGRREGFHPMGYRGDNENDQETLDSGYPNWYKFYGDILKGWNEYRKAQKSKE